MQTKERVSPATAVGDMVVCCPSAARVFEELDIDYCCHGKVSLADACAGRNLDPQAIISRIRAEQSRADSSPEEQDWSTTSLTSLCDHIEQMHHEFLQRELPRLSALTQKIAAVHGEKHPELHKLASVVVGLQEELQTHMFKEERVLFPAIRQLERSANLPQFPFGTVANPIRMMEHEHDSAGQALEQIRKLTNGFQAPDDACGIWRAALTGLQELEADLHRHIHKENNILFPRAAELESSLADRV